MQLHQKHLTLIYLFFSHHLAKGGFTSHVPSCMRLGELLFMFVFFYVQGLGGLHQCDDLATHDSEYNEIFMIHTHL